MLHRAVCKCFPIVFTMILIVMLVSCSKSDGTDVSDEFILHKDILKSEINLYPILFSVGNNQIDKTGVTQTSKSLLNVFVLVPTRAYLLFKFDNNGHGSTGYVQIRSDRGTTVNETYSESGEYQIELANFQGELIQITFGLHGENALRGDYKTSVTWGEIKIVTKQDAGLSQEKIAGRDSNATLEKILQKSKKGDVVYLVLDAFPAKHSSSFGYYRETSPFFDKLAKSNILFENMSAVAPYTLASTASLFTSTYIKTHTLINREDSLNEGIETIADMLTQNGIASYLISGHGFVGAPNWGLNRGFTKVYFDRKYQTSSENIVQALRDIYLAPDHLEKRKFIYIHITAPHNPYLPPEKLRLFTDKSYKVPPVSDMVLVKQNANEMINDFNGEQLRYAEDMFDSNILFADNILKDIYTYLEQSNKLERSIFIVTSDHGEAFNEHGKTGHWSTLYEEMIHIPFLMVFPEKVGLKPKRVKDVSSLVAIAPTIMKIFDIGSPDYYRGISLLPKILGDIPEPNAIFLEAPLDGLEAVRIGSYKLIKNRKSYELYDLANDPKEKNNIVVQKSVLTGWLKQELEKISSKGIKGRKHAVKTKDNQLDKEVLKSLKELGYIK